MEQIIAETEIPSDVVEQIMYAEERRRRRKEEKDATK